MIDNTFAKTADFSDEKTAENTKLRAKLSQTIDVGPVGFFFTNVNREMNLAGHSHTAWLTLVYSHDPARGNGFPVFDVTVRAVEDHLNGITAKPFRDCTNEKVAQTIWDAFIGWDIPEGVNIWGGVYELVEMRIGVQGVRDKIGHAHSKTVYTIKR